MDKIIIGSLLLWTQLASPQMLTYADYIHYLNPKLKPEQLAEITTEIFAASRNTTLEPALIAAVIAVESRFRVRATGSIGELGLMQLNPVFHKATYTIHKNIYLGTQYLASIRNRFMQHYTGSNWLELYNRGPASRPVTFTYTKKVMRYYAIFRACD